MELATLLKTVTQSAKWNRHFIRDGDSHPESKMELATLLKTESHPECEMELATLLKMEIVTHSVKWNWPLY